MSISIKLTQNGLFNQKFLPIEVILGDKLKYGKYDNRWRMVNYDGRDGYFIAYLPSSIGRGFEVDWMKNYKNHVKLLLPLPACESEIREFYKTVERIANYWDVSLTADGVPMTVNDWLGSLEDVIKFNNQALKNILQEVSNGNEEYFSMISAKWTMTLGKSEADKFADDPESFEKWLHEKQNIDAFYDAVLMVRDKDCIVGKYTLCDGCRTIFPKKPSVPSGMITSKRKPLKCDKFTVLLGVGGNELLGELPFDDFINRLPSNKVSRYDEACILIEPLSVDELKEMLY